MSKGFETLIQILHRIESYHDTYTQRHENCVGLLMEALARAMNCDEQYCADLGLAGNLHDIGKFAIPAAILEKPTALNAYERSVINMHPQIGHHILEGIDHPLAQLAANITISHHEAYDGSGYPFKLKQDAIPLEGRICSICDVYDALRAHRPYRDARCDHKTIVAKMLNKKENMYHKFDPDILTAFADIHSQFDDIFSSNNFRS